MFLELLLILCVFIAIFFIARNFYFRWLENEAIVRLIKILFPSGDEQMENTINDIDEMTHGRFTRDEILDYYLKIKGLQITDLHSNADSSIRSYLMKQTKVRLTYFELVKFYEIYLNYPQAIGESILNTNKIRLEKSL